MARYLAILAILVMPLSAPAPIVWAKDKPRTSDGDYNISVGGFAKGQGKASVGVGKLQIDAAVIAETGDKGQLSAKGLTITKNHFSGTGTVLGQNATFKGRLDAPDKVDEKAIKGVRLVATVKMDNGKYLRLVGFIPEQAQGKEGDDDAGEGHPRDRDRGGVTVPPVTSTTGDKPASNDHRDQNRDRATGKRDDGGKTWDRGKRKD